MCILSLLTNLNNCTVNIIYLDNWLIDKSAIFFSTARCYSTMIDWWRQFHPEPSGPLPQFLVQLSSSFFLFLQTDATDTACDQSVLLAFRKLL